MYEPSPLIRWFVMSLLYSHAALLRFECCSKFFKCRTKFLSLDGVPKCTEKRPRTRASTTINTSKIKIFRTPKNPTTNEFVIFLLFFERMCTRCLFFMKPSVKTDQKYGLRENKHQSSLAVRGKHGQESQKKPRCQIQNQFRNGHPIGIV